MNIKILKSLFCGFMVYGLFVGSFPFVQWIFKTGYYFTSKDATVLNVLGLVLAVIGFIVWFLNDTRYYK